MGTRGQWATDFAKALGNQNPDANTVNFVAAWTKGENTKAVFNPLATTYDNGDNTFFNHLGPNSGVRNYKSRQAGIDATVKTLQGNWPGYEDIREGIKLNDPERASNGLIRAPWGTNGAMVKTVWSAYDVRNESLLAESGGGDTGLNQLPQHRDSGQDHYTPGQSGGGSNDAQRARPGKADDSVIRSGTTSDDIGIGMQVGYVGLGLLLLGLSVFLVVRNYVPTTQIVRTIAAAAA